MGVMVTIPSDGSSLWQPGFPTLSQFDDDVLNYWWERDVVKYSWKPFLMIFPSIADDCKKHVGVTQCHLKKTQKTSPGTYDRLVISSPNARSLCHWKHSHEADPRAPKDRPPGWWWKSPSPVATRHSLQHTRDDLPSTEGSKDIQIGIQLILVCVLEILLEYLGIPWKHAHWKMGFRHIPNILGI